MKIHDVRLFMRSPESMDDENLNLDILPKGKYLRKKLGEIGAGPYELFFRPGKYCLFFCCFFKKWGKLPHPIISTSILSCLSCSLYFSLLFSTVCSAPNIMSSLSQPLLLPFLITTTSLSPLVQDGHLSQPNTLC